MSRVARYDTVKVNSVHVLNYPALKSGTRLSPIDGSNMNRVFPDSRTGTIPEGWQLMLYQWGQNATKRALTHQRPDGWEVS